jgi:hypothetical protein
MEFDVSADGEMNAVGVRDEQRWWQMDEGEEKQKAYGKKKISSIEASGV